MKVYELAKELKLETLVLMNQMRQWKIVVKSHMSSLDDETIQKVKTLFEEAANPKSAKKKKVTKKKTTAKKKTTSTAAKKKTTTKVATPIKTAQTSKTLKKQASATSQEQAVVKTSSKIIRRKKLTSQESVAEAAKSNEKDQQQTSPADTASQEGAVKSDAKTDGKTEDSESPNIKRRNIRPGFVAAPSIETEAKAAKAREAAKKKIVRKPQAQNQVNFLSSDFKKREVVFQPKQKKVIALKTMKKTELTTAKSSKRSVKMHETISVYELAQQMKLKSRILLKKLKENGLLELNKDSHLDHDTVALIVSDFDFEVQSIHRTFESSVKELAFGNLEAEFIIRPPIVTVMGHVDHGKTTLLDSIRQTSVVKKEAGGITQHIGAYTVTTKNKKTISFIDTPGHKAFTAMRERGADVTDIVILVVAADDGVMPQTVEALNHAKAAKAPVIVAVNKVDRPDSNPDKIKQALGDHELLPEEWGGETIYCEVSALKQEGIDELLEQIDLQAEILELKANPERSAEGVIIESRFEKGQGAVATLLVQDGTLKKSDFLVCADLACKVRIMTNDKGEKVQKTDPGHAVEISGFSEPPKVGSSFYVCETEKIANELAQLYKEEQVKKIKDAQDSESPIEDIFAKLKEQEKQELAVIVKADVVGSLEALKSSLEKLNQSTDEVNLKIVHTGVGAIIESDILLMSTLQGVVLGFNVRPDAGATQKAKEKSIPIHTYKIIYELLDDMKKMISGLLTPDEKEEVVATVEVREVYQIPKRGTIAGCFVTKGKIIRTNNVRLLRDGRIVYEGKLSSLRRFKDDVKEVAFNYECGLSIENFNDIKVGDTVEAFVIEKIEKELNVIP